LILYGLTSRVNSGLVLVPYKTFGNNRSSFIQAEGSSSSEWEFKAVTPTRQNHPLELMFLHLLTPKGRNATFTPALRHKYTKVQCSL